MQERTGIALEGVRSVILLNNGERMSRKAAVAAGYRILDQEDRSSSKEDPALIAKLEWKTAIIGSPEANGRLAAAVKLVRSKSPETMSVETARAFLRGLPTEAAETAAEPQPLTDPRAERLAEIANSTAAYNRNNGRAVKAQAVAPESIDPSKLQRMAEIRISALALRCDAAALKERRALAYALSVREQTGAPLATVFNQLGVDTSFLKNAR